MSRLVIAIAILALLGGLAFVLMRAAGALTAPGGRPLQRVSFVLLVALIFYASIWGGA
ncbi:hypothetical protein [Profundibacterium mesophilum]|uniref:Uncharacterized protein n=1 Tax=Profundibacterium mesophilum KAUST100406-0324 TaxID=1037889 RepID=A0A921NNX1_9RHOB|nr:hypothetical protein [Profundibacterium mesophilum]KAF0675381.1 hypothetical protein PMES_02271 [Profundibacterium mesophilum KAUST100406-0324]